jgi:hypothetical protein
MRRRRRNFFKRYNLKRHESRRFRNPYFKKSKRQIKIKWQTIAVLVVILFVLAALIYSSLFRINNVDIKGTEHIDPEQIAQIARTELDRGRFLIFPNNNRFFLHEERMQSKLNEHFVFDSIEMNVSRHTLTITVKERVSTLIWISADRYYFVDLSGTIIRELAQDEFEEAPNFPKFYDENNNTITVGQTVLSTNAIQGSIDFLILAEQGGITIDSFSYESVDNDWLAAKTTEGYWILFKPAEDIGEQVNNLIIVLRESIDSVNLIQYVDLRFGDHVYYK